MKYLIQINDFIVFKNTLREAIHFISVWLDDHEDAKIILKELVNIHEDIVYRIFKTYHIDNKKALELLNNED